MNVRTIPTVKDVNATLSVGMRLMNFVKAFLYDCLREDLNLSSPLEIVLFSLLLLSSSSFLLFGLFSLLGSKLGSLDKDNAVVVVVVDTNSCMN